MLLNDDDVIRADVIQQLMCHGELDMIDFGQHYGIEFRSYFATEIERLKALEKDGLIEIGANALQVTARGRFLMRIVAMCFDAYLGRPAQNGTPSYSKAL